MARLQRMSLCTRLAYGTGTRHRSGLRLPNRNSPIAITQLCSLVASPVSCGARRSGTPARIDERSPSGCDARHSEILVRQELCSDRDSSAPIRRGCLTHSAASHGPTVRWRRDGHSNCPRRATGGGSADRRTRAAGGPSAGHGRDRGRSDDLPRAGLASPTLASGSDYVANGSSVAAAADDASAMAIQTMIAAVSLMAVFTRSPYPVSADCYAPLCAFPPSRKSESAPRSNAVVEDLSLRFRGCANSGLVCWAAPLVYQPQRGALHYAIAPSNQIRGHPHNPGNYGAFGTLGNSGFM